MSEERYRVEDALIDDLDDIVAIYNETIPGRMVTADLDPVTVESRLLWFHQHSPNFRPLWVVKKEGVVIAWLSFQSFYGRPAYLGTAEISIYISSNSRSQGIGNMLIQRAIEVSPRLKINTLLGFVFAHNKPSISLLHKFNFVQWAHLPKVANLDGIERDLVILGRRVSNVGMNGEVIT